MTILAEKVLECKKGIIDSYNRRKTVDRFIVSEQTASMDDMFLNIGIRTLIDNIGFSSPSHVPFFDRFGDSIAIGEEKYFLETIISKSEYEEIVDITMDYDQLKKYSEEFMENSVLLVPLRILYSRMLQEPVKWAISYDYDIRSFILDFKSHRIPVYSIHEDIIDSNLVFLNRELGKWSYHVYPNPKFAKKTETIFVDITEANQLKVELLVQSSIKLEIENIKKVKRLKLV